MHLPWRPGDADSRDQLGQLPLRSPRCGLGPLAQRRAAAGSDVEEAAAAHRPGSVGLDPPRRPAVVRRRLARQLPRARAAGAVGAHRAAGRHRVAALIDRGFRGLARAREHWHAPVGDRRTKDRLTCEQRAYNRLHAGLRALVEQSISHLANAWALRRWRGMLCRVRGVFRAAAALICLGRWLHRVPA